MQDSEKDKLFAICSHHEKLKSKIGGKLVNKGKAKINRQEFEHNLPGPSSKQI